MSAIAATAEGVRGEHVVVPMSDVTRARLVLAHEASRIYLTAGDGEALCQGRFQSERPLVRVEGNEVTIDYGVRFLRKPGTSLVALNPDVTWEIDLQQGRFSGGAEFVVADLSGLRLASFRMDAGRFVDIVLGPPAGACTIQTGAVSHLSVRRPKGVPIQVSVVRSISRLTVDERELGTVFDHTWKSDGYPGASDRYQVRINRDSSVVRVGTHRTAPATAAPAQPPADRPLEKGESLGTVLIALSTNLAMLLLKAAAAVVTRSPALFAETLHSLTDTGNEILLLLALRRSRRPPDVRHPYGYGTEMYYWSLLAALSIFVAGGVLAMWEGLQQLLHPNPVANFVYGYAALGVGFVLDSIGFLVSLVQLSREAGTRRVSLMRHVSTTTDTTVTAVFMEDGAALVGGAIALVGLLLHQLTGSALPDALAALVIGAMLTVIGLRLSNRNRDLLTNRSESPLVLEHIRAVLNDHPRVHAVGRLATMYVGPHQLMLTAEIQAGHDLSGAALGALIAELRGRVMDEVSRIVDVYLMPVTHAGAGSEPNPFDPDYWRWRFPDAEQT